MTSMNTGISWTNSTLNPWVGCNKVSEGCLHCYAETLVNRLPSFKQQFDEVRLHLDRLKQVWRFRPMPDSNGGVSPHLVFINSMSDFWHDAVSDAVIFQALDALESTPAVIYQVLTKRPIRARRLLTQRYRGRGIPSHIWMGVSVEDNRVAKRLDIWRSLKERTGSGTFFVSVEPLIGPSDAMDFTGMDWVIVGGESGGGARRMERQWLTTAIEEAIAAGAAVWLKQHGTIGSHPNLGRAPISLGIKSRFDWLVNHGWEMLPHEKGGATLDKLTYRAFPTAYHTLKTTLNSGLLLV